jgi:hypothetical protein
MSEEKRNFAVEGSSIGFRGGHYTGLTPVQAAKKAGKALFQRVDKNPHFRRYKNVKSIKVMLRETTRTSTHEEFYYEIHRVEKKNPVKRTIAGVEVEYKFDYHTSACIKFNHLEHSSSSAASSPASSSKSN